MNTLIICPHCHSLIDPLTLEAAVSTTARYQICPECDRPITLFVERAEEDSTDTTLPGVSAVERQLVGAQTV